MPGTKLSDTSASKWPSSHVTLPASLRFTDITQEQFLIDDLVLACPLRKDINNQTVLIYFLPFKARHASGLASWNMVLLVVFGTILGSKLNGRGLEVGERRSSGLGTSAKPAGNWDGGPL